MSDILISAKGVGKTFLRPGSAPVEVLKQLALEVKSGESIAILGKSGSGKSTLLHLLGTLESPSEGEIQFEGKNIFAYREAEVSRFRNRFLGFVFQFHYLMLEFTALENVMMPALISGMGRSDAKARATKLLSEVGLADRAEHKPPQLSGGEQQRVAIARALIMGPKLLLTDEMTGNLDPATGAQVFELIHRLHSASGAAIISVTHDEVLAKRYRSRYRLEGGQLHPTLS